MTLRVALSYISQLDIPKGRANSLFLSPNLACIFGPNSHSGSSIQNPEEDTSPRFAMCFSQTCFLILRPIFDIDEWSSPAARTVSDQLLFLATSEVEQNRAECSRLLRCEKATNPSTSPLRLKHGHI